MKSSDGQRSRPASAATGEPHDPDPQGARYHGPRQQSARHQGPRRQDGGPQSPAPADPRLTRSRPYVDPQDGGPRGGPATMPRFAPALYDADDAAPPLLQRSNGRLALPAGGPPMPPAFPHGVPGAPIAQPAPPPGRAPLPPPPPAARGPRQQPVRAVIGDEIRIPFIWCEFGSCDATYTHPDALGERDLLNRALAAGWRYDALWRRACPHCAQHDPTFWTARPPAPAAENWRQAG